jgi:hypothetical protein
LSLLEISQESAFLTHSFMTVLMVYCMSNRDTMRTENQPVIEKWSKHMEKLLNRQLHVNYSFGSKEGKISRTRASKH